MDKQKFIDWCIEAHRDTNHRYAKIIPYEFHLQLVHNAAIKFEHVWDKIVFYTGFQLPFEIIECASYGHDLMTDCRKTYSDIIKAAECTGAGKLITEIIRAVSEDIRGRNREERMPDYIYEEICSTPGATFVKLADRIGNVEYGALMGKTGMYKTYQKEQAHFKDELYRDYYKEMWDYLDDLLKS
jgi:hypothetical protein